MPGAITQADKEFVEQWESIVPSSHGVIKLNYQGAMVHELIRGKRKFSISTAERKLTEEKVPSNKHNPFRNGSFRPIVVPDSVDVTTNPNALSDDEIRSVLVSSDLAWAEYLKLIDSPSTIARMVEMSESVDGLSLKRFRALVDRLEAVRPKTRIEDRDRDQYEKLLTSPAPPAS